MVGWDYTVYVITLVPVQYGGKPIL